MYLFCNVREAATPILSFVSLPPPPSLSSSLKKKERERRFFFGF